MRTNYGARGARIVRSALPVLLIASGVRSFAAEAAEEKKAEAAEKKKA